MSGSVTVENVDHPGAAFDAVIDLWKPNRRTLGLLPQGAFKQCAEEGGLVLARLGGTPAGYVAYRVGRRGAVIIHLCVAESHRGGGVAHALLDAVVEATSELPAVRLACREDYVQANRLWPKHGFRYMGDRPGRGRDDARLLIWCRQNADNEPLLSRMRNEERQQRRTVAIDANVFMDFYDEVDEHAAESQCLLADWLVDDVLVCATAELANEIARNTDAHLRASRLRQMRAFHTLEARPEDFEGVHHQVAKLLPAAANESDESDRRQLAHAVAERAEFFATRDDTLLRHAAEIEERHSIRVLRPVDVVNSIYGDYDPESYAPITLVGTAIMDRAPEREADLYPFQGFAQAEKKVAFLNLCRPLLGDPTRHRVRLLAPPDEDPVVAYAVEEDPSRSLVLISLLRTLGHPLTATLLRRFLAEQFTNPQMGGGFNVVCSDLVDPRAVRVARELGFRPSGSVIVKSVVRGLYAWDPLPRSVAGNLSGTRASSNPSVLERQFWPLKINDPDVPSFIVPIQPGWASQLFDTQLVEGELFPPDVSLALALENVYYSAARVRIPAGSRILWYVSRGKRDVVQEVRACSLCQETVRGPAREVFRRFRRLGVFRWRHALRKASGDPGGSITAYRFAFTERFAAPVPWTRVQEVLKEELGHGNQLAGPVRIPNEAFVTLYREATNGEL